MSDESNSESPTEFLGRKYPVLFAVLQYTFKRLEIAILAAVMAGCHYLDSRQEKSDVSWISKHLSDKQAQIEELKESK